MNNREELEEIKNGLKYYTNREIADKCKKY